ncbi:type II toxin-antitoxin system RelB/DinJ family antitoxin [Fructobacillus tropaeoli]|uniref:type II toxin-antitoxin system RelB/DinJ family antitoxin n=1 Tax=Fructobacillus tropaeoli TaxID=709323 RepID=UPI002D81F5DD|nr:Antitoxin component of the RelBE or YafQ-DinJ toxin-antitoxin module (RelB) [Fructobacillus tropaeoli]
MSYLHIRVDDTEKKNAEKVYKELGMTLSQATRLFLNQSVAVGGLPFDVKIQSKKASQEDK